MSLDRTRIASYFRRNSVTIALSVIGFCILAIFVLQALTIASLSKQVAGQNQTLEQLRGITSTISKNAQQRTVQIAGIDKHLDCIVQFFSQRDRTGKSIQDIDTCRINGTANGSSQPRTAPQSGSKASSGTSTHPSAQSQPQGSSAGRSSQPAQPNAIQRVTNPIVQLIHGLIV